MSATNEFDKQTKTSFPMWSKETQVLTPDGWTSSVEIGDLVATYNFKKDIVAYKPIKKRRVHKGTIDDTLYVCSNPNSLAHMLGDLNVCVQDKQSYSKEVKEWHVEHVQDIARSVECKCVAVSGGGIATSCDLTDDELRFIGLMFACGEYNKEKDQVLFDVIISTKAARYLYENLEANNLACTKLKYQKCTGKSVKKINDCHYIIVELNHKQNKPFKERIEPYLDFASSEAAELMSEQQFKTIIEIYKACRNKVTASFATMTCIEKSFADKLQKMSVFRNCNAVITRENKLDCDVNVIFTSKTAFSSSNHGIDEATGVSHYWLSQPALNKLFWNIETNGGGIVTRYAGRVTVLGGKL